MTISYRTDDRFLGADGIADKQKAERLCENSTSLVCALSYMVAIELG